MVHRASYKDRDGRTRRVSRYTANVDRPGGGRAKVTGFTSRRHTEALERSLEHLGAALAEGRGVDRPLREYFEGLPDRIFNRLVKLGLLQPRSGQRSRVLSDTILDFGEYLSAKGDRAAHVSAQVRRVQRLLVEECGFHLTSDIRAEPALLALARLRAARTVDGKERPGLAGTTSNKLRQACRSFTKWAAREGRLQEDPLVYLEAVEAKSASNRRALTSQEQVRLVAVTRAERSRAGLSGESRALLYSLALQTGLRRGELLSLTRSNFDLSGDRPAVTIEYGQAKNRKPARLPLRPETVAELRSYLRDRLPAARVFRTSTNYRASEVIAKDLEAAGIERETDSGVVDFHALRVTFISGLALAGVPLAQAQKLARHSTPMLTATVYSRFNPEEDAAAIGRLPNLAGSVS